MATMSRPARHEPIQGMTALINMHGREWRIVKRDIPDALFVMDEQGTLTGPYRTNEAAWAFIQEIAK